MLISDWSSDVCSSDLASHYDFDIDAPFEALSPEIRERVLYGSGDDEISFLYLNEKGRTTVKKHAFEGIIPNLERRWRETDRSEEHTSELQSLMRISYAVFCLKKKNNNWKQNTKRIHKDRH